MFIGPDRGGQGLVGAMLDAHPNAVIAPALSLFESAGARGRIGLSDPPAIFKAIIKSSRRSARRGRKSVRVRPRVANVRTSQAIDGQGFRPDEALRVIGTDRAPDTARALNANPDALDDLAAAMQLDVRLIHVVRNPFDNLTSMGLAAPHQPVFGIYRWIAETIAEIDDHPILRVHLEDLIADPVGELARICEFLGLEASDEYLRACAAIVVSPSHESRHEREWSREQIAEVEDMMATLPWLGRYRSVAPPEAARQDRGSTQTSVPMPQGWAPGSDWESRLDDVRTFCAFVGHTRSGHSLVGALIDAHPNAIVSHHGRLFGTKEMTGVLALPDREKLFRSLVSQSMAQAVARSGQRRTREGGRERYSYAVPGQWQGRFNELRVLGTQHAHDISSVLDANPAALDELAAVIGTPLRLISVVRNPWDHVESMGRGVGRERADTRRSILDHYILRSRMIQRAKDAGYDVIDVSLEELISDPHTELRRICEFLEVEPHADYLEACAGLVFDSPNETHRDHDWTGEELEGITAAIDEFPWLERYRSVERPTATPTPSRSLGQSVA